MTNKKYFNNLNYTLGNEDTSLEYALLPKSVNHVFSVAGSGSRILPLLAKEPKQLTCVDSSLEQLYFTELRIEFLNSFEYKEYLAFWDYPPESMISSKRKKIFQKLNLSDTAYKFIKGIFEENNWNSLLYIGRWERTFSKLSRINKLITGKKAEKLFDYTDPSGYYKYLSDHFPHKAWAFTIFLLGNAAVFNTLLYKGHFPKKNIPENLHQFYLNAFTKLFNQGPARNNFFLQLLFFGKLLFPQGNPIECDKKIFSLAKQAIKKTKISYIHGNLIEEAAKADQLIDFFSFSDVPSYFDNNLEKNFLQIIHPKLSPNCILVIRNYLRIPEGTDTRGYEDITNKYTDIISQEKIQMYVIKILRKI